MNSQQAASSPGGSASFSVFAYHGLSVSPLNAGYVTPEQLEQHTIILKASRVPVKPLTALLGAAASGVAISFDDAPQSVYDLAAPLLNSAEVTATVFVPVNYVGSVNTFDCLITGVSTGVEKIMDWNCLRELHACGWSIQSHGCSHFPLDQLPAGHIREELRRSKHVIEDRLGSEVLAFSHPFGLSEQEGTPTQLIADELQAAGYKLAFLAWGGSTVTPPSDPYRIPRVLLSSFMSSDEFQSNLPVFSSKGRGVQR